MFKKNVVIRFYNPGMVHTRRGNPPVVAPMFKKTWSPRCSKKTWLPIFKKTWLPIFKKNVVAHGGRYDDTMLWAPTGWRFGHPRGGVSGAHGVAFRAPTGGFLSGTHGGAPLRLFQNRLGDAVHIARDGFGGLLFF